MSVFLDAYNVPVRVGSTVVVSCNGNAIQRGRVVKVKDGKLVMVKTHKGYCDGFAEKLKMIREQRRIVVVTERLSIPTKEQWVLEKDIKAHSNDPVDDWS